MKNNSPKICIFCGRPILHGEPKVSRRLWVEEEQKRRYTTPSYEEAKRQHGKVRGKPRKYAHLECFEERRY